MATTIRLSPETTSLIAAQIGAFVSASGLRLAREDAPEVGETLQVWMLPSDAVISATPLQAATPTGKWHHQIYRHGKPELFAYSQPFGPRASDWQVTAAFESDVAPALDEAIEVVDRAFPGEEEARLLVIPAYAIQAIWVVDQNDNHIIPAVVPSSYRETVARLTIYESPEFFRRLQSQTHIQGILP